MSPNMKLAAAAIAFCLAASGPHQMANAQVVTIPPEFSSIFTSGIPSSLLSIFDIKTTGVPTTTAAVATGTLTQGPAPTSTGAPVKNPSDLSAPVLKRPPGSSPSDDECALAAGSNVPISYVEFAHQCFSKHNIDRDYKGRHVVELKSYYNLVSVFLPEFGKVLKQMRERWDNWGLDTIARHLQKDSAQNGDFLYPAKIDLFAELDKLVADDSITKGFDFHSRITDLISSMNDAHSSYAAQCYRYPFYFIQPWDIVYRYTDGSSTPTLSILRDTYSGLPSKWASSITTSAVNALWSEFLNNKTPKDYIGWTVTAIDGNDPVKAVQEYADKYSGFSRDPNSRFNMVLTQFQYAAKGFTPTSSLFSRTDHLGYGAKTYRSYSLKSPSGETATMTVPWLAFRTAESSVSSYSTYFSYYCSYPITSTQGLLAKGPIKPLPHLISRGDENATLDKRDDSVDVFNDFVKGGAHGLDAAAYRAGGYANFWRKFPANPDIKAATAQVAIDAKKHAAEFEQTHNFVIGKGFVGKSAVGSSSSGALQGATIKFTSGSDDYFGFGMLDDGVTGIFVLSTFAPDLRDYGTGAFLARINKLGSVLATGLTTLKNLGAKKLIVDTSSNGGGYVCLSAALVKYFKSESDIESFDIVQNDAGKALLKTDSFKEYGSSGSRSKTRGGVQGQYTNTFGPGCPNSIPGSSPFDLNDVVMLTDGFCGSACAMFTNSLKDDWGFRTYSYGGSSGAPYAPMSFNGGFVYTMSVLASNDSDTGVGKTTVTSSDQQNLPIPFSFPTSGGLIMTEGYSVHGKGGEDIPVEWVKSVSDGFIAVSKPEDRTEAYAKAAEMLQTAKPIQGNQTIPDKSLKLYVILIIVGIVLLVVGGIGGFCFWLYRRHAKRVNEGEDAVPKNKIEIFAGNISGSAKGLLENSSKGLKNIGSTITQPPHAATAPPMQQQPQYGQPMYDQNGQLVYAQQPVYPGAPGQYAPVQPVQGYAPGMQPQYDPKLTTGLAPGAVPVQQQPQYGYATQPQLYQGQMGQVAYQQPQVAGPYPGVASVPQPQQPVYPTPAQQQQQPIYAAATPVSLQQPMYAPVATTPVVTPQQRQIGGYTPPVPQTLPAVEPVPPSSMYAPVTAVAADGTVLTAPKRGVSRAP
ncbi:hypothetical protein HDU97_006255 [Phlyctochytrium planicorne]|nr:hypothetical protein HDU97_006255 [Phlyctochytrium planicorne]